MQIRLNFQLHPTEPAPTRKTITSTKGKLQIQVFMSNPSTANFGSFPCPAPPDHCLLTLTLP
jgi:hypothetical protein